MCICVCVHCFEKNILATLMKCLIVLALISLRVSDATVVTTQYISSLGIYKEGGVTERERERGGGTEGEKGI